MWYAIILAGGTGSRMQSQRNKVLLPLAGEAVIVRSVRAFSGLVDGIVVVSRPEDRDDITQLLTRADLMSNVRFAEGGTDRQGSVWNGLCMLPDGCDRVMIHDGARCLVDAETISRVKQSVRDCGTGIAAIPAVDTIKQADADGYVTATPDRASLRIVQTPQGFDREIILKAHWNANESGFRGTDDASLVEHMGLPVHLCLGARSNIKLTTPEDMKMAESLLNVNPLPDLRVGQGYDVHRLVDDRKLILCGVEVPHTLGLLGHSDADVAVHALMDAMLGAMALGDIGKHFPDTDPQYSGISSMKLLAHVVALLAAHHARVTNADVTIVAQKPKLLPYIPQMRQNIANALVLPETRVNIKATTTEKLGFEGMQEGISSQAVVMVQVMEN